NALSGRFIGFLHDRKTRALRYFNHLKGLLRDDPSQPGDFGHHAESDFGQRFGPEFESGRTLDARDVFIRRSFVADVLEERYRFFLARDQADVLWLCPYDGFEPFFVAVSHSRYHDITARIYATSQRFEVGQHFVGFGKLFPFGIRVGHANLEIEQPSESGENLRDWGIAYDKKLGLGEHRLKVNLQRAASLAS